MRLYTMPGACSLAANIALREAGIPFEVVKVSHHTHKTHDGVDLNAINSKGYVPALVLDNGELLTENVALLPYIADLKPARALCGSWRNAHGSFDRPSFVSDVWD